METTKVREDRESRSKWSSIVKFNKKSNNNKKSEKETEALNGGPVTPKVTSKVTSASTYQEAPGSNLSLQRLTACMLKTCNRMKKRIGFLLYQFVLPALQVKLPSFDAK